MLALASVSARAEVEFTATADESVISIDDSVSVKFQVRADSSFSGDRPTFHAPAFQEINEYSGSSTQSVLQGGRIETSIIQELTVVFRPKERGNHKISNIKIKVDGKEYKAPDIAITVSASGGTPQGQGSDDQPVRGVQKTPSKGIPFFVRADVSKQSLYKGEQVIISYSLYRKVGLFNISVEKYPSLSGFLKEELEMPIVAGRRLNSERVIVDGTQYERSLLVKYAAYPLKSGKLQVDGMAVKASYQGSLQQGLDDDHDLFSTFFQQAVPRTSQQKSALISLEILPLPEDGRPDSFSGGVGDFRVTASLDKNQAKVNDPVTVRVQVDGRGNLSGVGEPKVDWPRDFEVYESKDNIKTSQSGVGVKTFEILLIPRAGGKFSLPGIEMSFFDPAEKKYKIERTAPMELNVSGEGAPAAQPSSPGESSPSTTPKSGNVNVESEDLDVSRWIPVLRGIGYAILAILLLAGLVLGARRAFKFLKDRDAHPEQVFEREWKKKRAQVETSMKSSELDRIVEGYEALAGLVFDAIDRYFKVGARSLPRGDLGRRLTEEKGVSESSWKQAAQILEYSETVRFATKAGAVTVDEARTKLSSFLSQVDTLRAGFATQSK